MWPGAPVLLRRRRVAHDTLRHRMARGEVVVMLGMRVRRDAVDPRHHERREQEGDVDRHLPDHGALGNGVGIDEGFQQMNRRNADERHRELHLEHAGVHMIEPFGFVGVAFEAHARDEGLVAADNHHDEQIRDHHHVDQAQHGEHDAGFVERHRVRDEMPDFLDEQHAIDRLPDDQAEVQRHLQPAAHEDDAGQQTHAAAGRRLGTSGGHVRCGSR
ncbi:hypothetical protein PT2222_40003 [Paraburkholderia tropica]